MSKGKFISIVALSIFNCSAYAYTTSMEIDPSKPYIFLGGIYSFFDFKGEKDGAQNMGKGYFSKNYTQVNAGFGLSLNNFTRLELGYISGKNRDKRKSLNPADNYFPGGTQTIANEINGIDGNFHIFSRYNLSGVCSTIKFDWLKYQGLFSSLGFGVNYLTLDGTLSYQYLFNDGIQLEPDTLSYSFKTSKVIPVICLDMGTRLSTRASLVGGVSYNFLSKFKYVDLENIVIPEESGGILVPKNALSISLSLRYLL